MTFYSELGVVETFRTPASGEPSHIQLKLDGLSLGIATVETTKEHHGLRPQGEGRWIEIVLWTEDTDAAVNTLVAKGAPLIMTFSMAGWARLGSLIRTAIPSNSFSAKVETARRNGGGQCRQRHDRPRGTASGIGELNALPETKFSSAPGRSSVRNRGALEARAVARDNTRCCLHSTETVRRFYHAAGYCEDGPPDPDQTPAARPSHSLSLSSLASRRGRRAEVG